MEAIKKSAAHEGATNQHELRIAQFCGDVNLAAYMDEKGIKGKQAAEAVRRAGYVKCDKQVVSKVVNSHAYGITFTPTAWSAIYRAYGAPSETVQDEPVKRARIENRMRGVKLCVRFTKSEYARVLLAKEQSGAASMQEFLAGVVLAHAEGVGNG